jgi:hypothetical protein
VDLVSAEKAPSIDAQQPGYLGVSTTQRIGSRTDPEAAGREDVARKFEQGSTNEDFSPGSLLPMETMVTLSHMLFERLRPCVPRNALSADSRSRGGVGLARPHSFPSRATTSTR